MTTAKPRNQGFTTIELLVVIAVIAILVALTTGAVQRVRVAAKRAETASEAGQLATAVGVFLKEKRVDYLPSRIVLRERMDYDSSNALEVASATYLKQVWPQIPLALSPGAVATPFGVGAGIDWNNSGSIETGPVVLDGDQCLVFFLGGIPVAAPNSRYQADGFGKNPQNPAAAPRGGSSFEFKTARLKTRPAAIANLASQRGFPSFYDPYDGQPFAYFSSYGRKNGYQTGDCSTLSATLTPYRDTASTYYQPTGFQVISAGIDENYGVGGLAPSATTSLGQPDADNVTNFANGQISNINN